MDFSLVSQPEPRSASEIATRLNTLTSWNSDWVGLRVGVLGLGVTGFAAADTLAELGAEVVVVATDAPRQRARLLDVIGARLILASNEAVPPALVEYAPELLIVSPGYYPNHPILKWAAANDIAVWGDIELAWRVRDKTGTPAEWMLVTGTNGKTTTVQMTATLLAASGLRAAPAGNIGIPVLDAVRDPGGFDVLVIELSSYQLHHLPRTGPGALVPWASVCLNIADDHIDWHGSAQAYRDAKATVYENTKVACVYNKADLVTMHMVEEADVQEGARAIGFGLGAPGPSDLGIVEGILCDRAFHEDRRDSAIELTTLGELAEAGLTAPHVIANILAASALARSYGVEPGIIKAALAEFRLDSHRIELVATASGVTWIDDSKATNPHAADASLTAYKTVVWVVGGLLKGVDIDDLVSRHANRLRAAVIIGVDRSAVRDAFARHAPSLPVWEVVESETTEVMPSAVRLAAAVAEEGDTVLLAPAAASMDQFLDYSERGRQFAVAVRQHVEANTGGEADGDTASTRD